MIPRRAYLLLGSNLGDRQMYMDKAIEEISEFLGSPISVSSIYETESWGFPSDNMFLNQLVVVETELPPGKLMQACLDIERRVGRRRRSSIGDRKIDIDILLLDNEIVRQKHCTIPHPRLHLRKFALIPLLEVDPELVHPELEIKLSIILELIQDSLKVIRFEEAVKKT